MKLISLVLVSLLALGGCVSSPSAVVAGEADRDELLRLNERLVRSQILEKDPAFLEANALENVRFLAPGGLIEGKQQVIAGLSGWDAVDVELTGTEITFYENIAIVSGRMDIDGTMRPVGRWGPLKYMSTWVKEDDGWKLLSRSLTPCLEKLVQLGRC